MKRLLLLFLLLTLIITMIGCDNKKSTTKYTLTVEIEGSGELAPEEGTHKFTKDTVVKLTATAADGWRFKEWIGEVAEAGKAETTVLMDKDRTVKAIFEEDGEDNGEEGNPVIVSIGDVNDIEVSYGTSKSGAIALLAESTTIIDSEETEHSVDLSWSITDYDGSTAGDYSATGTFELPEGIEQSDPETPLEVTATVKVLAQGSDANLTSLTVSPGELTPEFSAAETDYIVDVDDDVDSIGITAALSDSENAQMKINGENTASGSTKTIELNDPGQSTDITIVVSAANGDTRTYTITVNRAALIYTVTFDSNGGDIEADPKTMQVEEGKRLEVLPAEPARTTYSFVEWNEAGDGSGSTFTADTVVNRDMTVYAQWEELTIQSFSFTLDPLEEQSTTADYIAWKMKFNMIGNNDTAISYSSAIDDYNLDPAASTISFQDDDGANIESTSLDLLYQNTNINSAGDTFLITLLSLEDVLNYNPLIHTKIKVKLVPTDGRWNAFTETVEISPGEKDYFCAVLIDYMLTYLLPREQNFKALPGDNIVDVAQDIASSFIDQISQQEISLSLAETGDINLVNNDGFISINPQDIGQQAEVKFNIAVGSLAEGDYISRLFSFTIYGLSADYSSVILPGGSSTIVSQEYFDLQINLRDTNNEIMSLTDSNVKIESSLEDTAVLDDMVNFSDGQAVVKIKLSNIGEHLLKVTVGDIVSGIVISSDLIINSIPGATIEPEIGDYILGSGNDIAITLNPMV